MTKYLDETCQMLMLFLKITLKKKAKDIHLIDIHHIDFERRRKKNLQRQ